MTQSSAVIIPTFNGLHRLKLTLPFLLSQSAPPSEYILVIDGSDDGTCEWISSQQLPRNFAIHYQSNGGRSSARNRGAQQARSDLLIFVDDDIRVPFDFVERHQNLHALYPDSLISGDVRQDLDNQRYADICGFRRYCESKWTASIPPDRISCTFHFTTQNLSVERAVFQALGGFDARLNDSEDFLLGVLAVKHSVAIYYDPAIVCLHCDYCSLSRLAARNVEYILSKKKLADLYPEIRELYPYVLEDPSAASLVRLVFRGFFVISPPWTLLVNSRLFLSLPVLLRYKVYDYLLSSTVAWSLIANRISRRLRILFTCLDLF